MQKNFRVQGRCQGFLVALNWCCNFTAVEREHTEECCQPEANRPSSFFCFCFREEECTYVRCMPIVKQICFRSRNGNYRCQEIGSILMIGTLAFLESWWWTALSCNSFALQNYPLYKNNEVSSISERWLSKFKVKNPPQTPPKNL